ncbi:ATP-binding protein [Streptomyces fradiae]|uniref:ATP-binding protein n=1 Tax=Streptomyces fradiae TaxID=1906 RepID=UPI0029431C54|nr:ATP-binding protein [Streptomyces fradiae]WOI61248.1 ATP-binding protein [Streptomyces fradiae]
MEEPDGSPPAPEHRGRNMTAAEHPAAHPARQPPARAAGGAPPPTAGGPPDPVPERPPAHPAADGRRPTTADRRQPSPEGAPAEARPPTAAGPPTTPDARPPTAGRPPGDPADGRHRAVAAARARVRGLLRTRAAGPVPPRVEDDVLLVVTELVTNALRHGGGVTAFHAELDGDGDALTVEVADASPAPPHTRPHGDDPAAVPGGFGWPLVRRLSHRVAVTPTPGGKTVRAVLRLGPGA